MFNISSIYTNELAHGRGCGCNLVGTWHKFNQLSQTLILTHNYPHFSAFTNLELYNLNDDPSGLILFLIEVSIIFRPVFDWWQANSTILIRLAPKGHQAEEFYVVTQDGGRKFHFVKKTVQEILCLYMCLRSHTIRVRTDKSRLEMASLSAALVGHKSDLRRDIYAFRHLTGGPHLTTNASSINR